MKQVERITNLESKIDELAPRVANIVQAQAELNDNILSIMGDYNIRIKSIEKAIKSLTDTTNALVNHASNKSAVIGEIKQTK